jgi:hypothetical protein
VRRFLERFGEGVKTIVFCVDNDEDLAIYYRVLPLYFPRDKAEEARAARLLPAETGNELGESVIAERQIRISAMPGLSDTDSLPLSGGYSALAGRSTLAAAAAAQASSPSAAASAAEEKEKDITKPQPPPEEVRASAKSKKQVEEEEAELRYARALAKAREENLADMEERRFVYLSGTDAAGRDVVVFVAQNLPASADQLERVLLYLIHLLDPVVNRDYTVVYFHTDIKAENKPPLGWLREVYGIFNRKYKKNLKRLFIVHPSWWVKVVLFFVSPFVSSKFWKKVEKVDSIHAMHAEVDPNALRIPAPILDYDRAANPANYQAAAAPAKDDAAPPQGAQGQGN